MEDIKNFETQFARLQAIVSELETGATSLEKG
ncbi:MAG: exodeoxyribonuclease VII small subunit, partial [Desulfovibrio sp.]|nr:exodeoxyribonuclease VII small subunit [Desulfovibrio sp.]